MTRREFLIENGMALAGLATASSGCVGLVGNCSPAVRLGCVSDSHFGDIASRGCYHFRDSDRKMSEALSCFRRQGVDFVIELGDLIDSGENDKLRVEKSLMRIESVFRSCSCPAYHVVGNHDFGCLSPDEFFKIVGMKSQRGDYSFEKGGILFVVLDGCYTGDGQHYMPGNFAWTDAQLPDNQLQWLQNTLANSSLPAVIFCHHPIVGADERHRLRNAAEVEQILEKSGKVKSVFSGHYHAGGYVVKNDCTYRILQAHVSEWANGAIVSVYADGSAQMEYIEP